MNYPHRPLWERFTSGYEVLVNGCWRWRKGHTYGYGRMSIGCRPVRAHRFAWQLFNGPIPAGLCVLHRCDNPRCVNPDHLFLGTPLDNSRDMIRKGRQRYIGAPPRIPAETVHAIRAAEGTYQAIADRFGVSPMQT